jgi:hypothetical protein
VCESRKNTSPYPFGSITVTDSFGNGHTVGQKVGLFFQMLVQRAQRVAPPPMVVVRLPPSNMRAESKGVRASSEAKDAYLLLPLWANARGPCRRSMYRSPGAVWPYVCVSSAVTPYVMRYPAIRGVCDMAGRARR